VISGDELVDVLDVASFQASGLLDAGLVSPGMLAGGS
jgi:hypothetical protein